MNSGRLKNLGASFADVARLAVVVVGSYLGSHYLLYRLVGLFLIHH
jgi:hypothetical protein